MWKGENCAEYIYDGMFESIVESTTGIKSKLDLHSLSLFALQHKIKE